MQTADRVSGDLTGVVWVAPCAVVGANGSDRAFSAAATDAWKLTGTVSEISAEQTTFQISWQRLRRGGQEEQSGPQSATLTLKRGERQTLETLSIPAQGSCAGRNVSFDAVFASIQEMYPGKNFGGGAGAGRASSSGGGSGSGLGSGSGAGARTTTSGSGGGVGGNVVTGRVVKGAPSWARTMHADLWLVRTSPGRADETLHVTAAVAPFPASFAFSPLTIQTASGAFTVKVEGTIESGLTPTGESQLYFSANRTTSLAPTTRAARDTAPTVEGSTKTSVPMPSNDDVLSFEMPPLRVPGGVTVPDKLSIRVKLTREQ